MGFFCHHPDLPERELIESLPGKKRPRPPVPASKTRRPPRLFPKLTKSRRLAKKGHFCGNCLKILRGRNIRLTWTKRLIASEDLRTRWDNMAEVFPNPKKTFVRCEECHPSISELRNPIFYELMWEIRRDILNAEKGSDLEPEVMRLRDEVLPVFRDNLKHIPDHYRPHPVEVHWQSRIDIIEQLVAHLEPALKIKSITPKQQEELLTFFNQGFDL